MLKSKLQPSDTHLLSTPSAAAEVLSGFLGSADDALLAVVIGGGIVRAARSEGLFDDQCNPRFANTLEIVRELESRVGGAEGVPAVARVDDRGVAALVLDAALHIGEGIGDSGVAVEAIRVGAFVALRVSTEDFLDAF